MQKITPGLEYELQRLRAENSALTLSLEEAKSECSRLNLEQVRCTELEERYYLAFLGAQDGLWDFYLDGSRSFVSERFKQILGYDDSDIGAAYKFWWRKIHILDRQRAHKALIDHFHHRKPYDLAIRMQTKQDHYRWVNIRGCAVWDDAGKPLRICGSLRDVTGQIVADQVMRIQYEIAKTTLSPSNMESFHQVVHPLMATVGWAAGAIWLLKPDRTGTQKLTLSRTFGTTHELYEHPEDEETLATIMQVVQRNTVLYEPTEKSTNKRCLFGYSQGFKQALIFPLQSGDKVLGAAELFHPDIREYRVEFLELVRFLGTQIGSLVDRLQVQRELKERERQLSSIVDSAPDGIITLCGHEIITANAAAHHIFGFGKDNLIGRTVSEIMPGLAKNLIGVNLNRQWYKPDV